MGGTTPIKYKKVVSVTCRAIGSATSRSKLAKPIKRSGSLTSSPVAVKLITNAIRAGIRTDKLIKSSAGNKNAHAVRLLRTKLGSLLRE
jgi:hypothetical protein